MTDDNKIYLSCAMRGRYNEDDTTSQHLEVNTPDYMNCLTGVSKDCLVLEIVNE